MPGHRCHLCQCSLLFYVPRTRGDEPNGLLLLIGKLRRSPEKILVAAFMDSYNQMVRAARNYQAQTVKGGLGTGGAMQADGAPTKPAR